MSDGERGNTSNRHHQTNRKKCKGEGGKEKAKKEWRRASRFKREEWDIRGDLIVRVGTLRRGLFE